MEFFELLCLIFCFWDAIIIIILGAILWVAIIALKRLKAIDERHAEELFLQTKMYTCLLKCTVIMEQNWLKKRKDNTQMLRR